eukprot:3467044-Prymnesium_polylepis.1
MAGMSHVMVTRWRNRFDFGEGVRAANPKFQLAGGSHVTDHEVAFGLWCAARRYSNAARSCGASGTRYGDDERSNRYHGSRRVPRWRTRFDSGTVIGCETERGEDEGGTWNGCCVACKRVSSDVARSLQPINVRKFELYFSTDPT